MHMSRQLPRHVFVFVLIIVTLLVGSAAIGHPAPAMAASPTDGRINLIPWVNSWGAIAVYCVDKFDHPGDNFTGGGIKILGENGQKLFFAREALIIPAQKLAD